MFCSAFYLALWLPFLLLNMDPICSDRPSQKYNKRIPMLRMEIFKNLVFDLCNSFLLFLKVNFFLDFHLVFNHIYIYCYLF